MRKVLTLELDYNLTEEELFDEQRKAVRYGHVSRNLITRSFHANHNQGMNVKTARVWRSISTQIEEVLECNLPNIILSESEFSAIYDELYKCKLDPRLAFLLPVLCDELDRVKNLDKETREKELEEAEHLYALKKKVIDVIQKSKIPPTPIDTPAFGGAK